MFKRMLTWQNTFLSISWLLVVSALEPQGLWVSRSLKQADESTLDATKVVEDAGRRPFLALKDTTHAASEDIQRLYEQSGQASAIAYLLFAAAHPLSQVEGSSAALLPCLTPTLIRLYVSHPGRCSSPLARQLYDMSLSLCGTTQLRACHYNLYLGLESTFSWIRDNMPLRLQEVPDQPLASAMWPDLELQPPLELTAAVTSALAEPDQLGDTAAVLSASCGMEAADFAALVPDIAAVLKQLHADLPLLQGLLEQVHASRYSEASSKSGDHRRAMLREWENQHSELLHRSHNQADSDVIHPDNPGLDPASADMSDHGDGISHRRSALTLPPNFSYSFPPSNFVVQAPGLMPQLMIPLVFHIMLYRDGNSVGPAKYEQSAEYVERMVRVTNIMSKAANIQFFIRDVRNNPDTYPYLLLSDRATWLTVLLYNCTGSSCFSNADFMYKNVWDYPRSVNVFISSDSTAGVPLGYAFVGGSDVFPDNGHVFVSWDSLSFDGSNSQAMYDDGPNTLLHELYHHMGLYHPFDFSWGYLWGTCYDGDYVIDTPASKNPISGSSFYPTAQAYCMELFWGQYGGDWEAAYGRWSSTLGIPETDMNAWADSCPSNAGYDELGNYMTYNTPVCFAALGHFTAAQAQRAMLVTSEVNPLMYAWGQYYAQNAAPPPPQMSPPPALVNNTCRSTARSACACKSAWQLNGVTYSYCDRIGSTNALSCEVADPSTCADCSPPIQCVLPCAGTARTCKRPPAPGTKMPPPPPPRLLSPPPMPPPPPPRVVPSECKKTRSGCDCRRTWSYRGYFYSYCGSPDGEYNLWCQVSPTCSSFNNSSPYQYCPFSLTCGGRVVLTTSRFPPAPPAPPPDLRPRPPPPSTGPVATVSGNIVINADCLLITNNATELNNSLRTELAAQLQVPISYITIDSMDCGVLVSYSVSFPMGATITQVESVAANAMLLVNLPYFASRWGGINESTSTQHILQPSALCSASADGARFCSPPPPSPGSPSPPGSNKSFSTNSIIILAASIAGVAVLGLLIFLAVYFRRKSRVVPSQFTPQAPDVRAGNAFAQSPSRPGSAPIAPQDPPPPYPPPQQYPQQQYPSPQYSLMPPPPPQPPVPPLQEYPPQQYRPPQYAYT